MQHKLTIMSKKIKKNPLDNQDIQTILIMLNYLKMTASIYAKIPEKSIKQSPNGFEEIEKAIIGIENFINQKLLYKQRQY